MFPHFENKTWENLTSHSLSNLEKCLQIAARVVALYGDVYVPIFERVHDEVLKVRQKGYIKLLAINIAIDYHCEID